MVCTEPALAEGRNVAATLAVDEEGVVVPNHVGGVDGEEVGQWKSVLGLRPELLHLVCYLDEVGRAVILLCSYCHSTSVNEARFRVLHAECLPLVAIVAGIYEL